MEYEYPAADCPSTTTADRGFHNVLSLSTVHGVTKISSWTHIAVVHDVVVSCWWCATTVALLLLLAAWLLLL